MGKSPKTNVTLIWQCETKNQCIPVAHSATKVWACFLSTGLFSLLTGSWDRKWSMKSRGVTEPRSHFSLFKTSSSICCEWWGQREGQKDRFKSDPGKQMQGLTKMVMIYLWKYWLWGGIGGKVRRSSKTLSPPWMSTVNFMSVMI